jgi:hypothetical protein
MARALGVDFGALRRRLAETEGSRGGDGAGRGDFVELSGAQLLGVNGLPGSVVEVWDASGVRLTIRLASNAPLDVAGLVAGFCRRDR